MTAQPLAPPARPTGHPPSGPAFVRDLARHGSALAVATADAELTYADLARRVERLAERLGGGRRLVLVAGANRVDVLVGYLAALAAGHVVLLAPAEGDAGLDRLLGAYDPDVVLTADDGEDPRVELRHEGTRHDLHPDLALLLTTSGSTGSPKLVRLSHGNLEANAEQVADVLAVRPGDRAALALPLHYCYGLSVLHSHLLRGAAVVLTSLSVVDACFWELFRARRCTTLPGVPHTFELLDRVGFAEMELPHLRAVTQAGGRLAPEQVRRWAAVGQRAGWDLFVMYGQTEATARMACLPPDLAAAAPASIGRPVPGGAFRLDPAPELGPDVGELVYTGPNVMLGYALGPADLARGAELTELRTGDLGRRTPDGLYEVVGRRSRFAKAFGVRIDLQDLEATLASAGTPAACVEAAAGGLLVAAETGPDDADPLRRRVAALCGLPAGAVRVVAVERLPRLPSGKVDLPAVRALERPAPTVAVPPAGDARALVAVLLDRPDATDDDTFVGLGGDSLSYVEVSLRLEELLGHLPAGWHTTRLGDLAPAAGPRRRGRAVETGVLLRAVAIVLIVGTHADALALVGGAHVLVGIAGYNLARFQLASAERAERVRGLLRSALRVAVPSVAWIGAVAWLSDRYDLSSALLVHTVVGPREWGPGWQYWFVESVVHLLLGLAVLLAVPAVTRAERRWPFGFAAALVGVGLLLRAGPVELGPGGIHTPQAVLWLLALGWATARSRMAWHRLAVTAALVATVPGFAGDPRREAVVLVGLLLLVWVPSVRVPAAVGRLAGLLAASSLHVYVTHWQVYPHLEADSPWLATAASFAVGLAYWRLHGLVAAQAGRLRSGRSAGRMTARP